MRSSLLRVVCTVVLVGAVASTLAGCSAPGTSSELDSKEPIDRDKGRQLFQAHCRVCHSLADANAAGVFGPDLDQLQPDPHAVRRAIDEGGGGMPRDIITGADADLVARYVAEVAGSGPPPEEQSGDRDAVKPTGGE